MLIDWQAQADAFHHRMRTRLDVLLTHRREHGRDPVMDFLFQYYHFKPAKLTTWSPGLDVVLSVDAAPYLDTLAGSRRTAEGVMLDPECFPEHRQRSARWMLQLLLNTQARAPYFGCAGMHEWAMVYRTDDVRHAQVPLRVDAATLENFVESRPLRCTHFDAFRFFTPEARPLNQLQPTRDTTEDLEQPGCLHANMDLYKWAYKLYPWISSDLIADAFELAVRARVIDMRASPYDMQARGLEPITVETPAGRQAYTVAQRELWEAGQPIRARLINAYRTLVSHFPSHVSASG